MTRRAWTVGIVLTAVLLGLTLRDINPEEFLASLGRGQYGWVWPALLVTVAGYLLRVARWKAIVGPRFDSKLSPYTAVIVGFAVNNLFPARLGEFVRAYIGAKHSDQRKTFFLATIVFERILDGLTLVAILTAVSLFTELPFEIRTLQVVGALLFVAAAVTVWLAARMEAHALRLMGMLLRFLPPRIYRWADLRLLSFFTGFGRIRQPSDLLKLGAYSIAVWTCEMTAYAMIMRVFSVTPSGVQSVSAPAFLLSVVNLSIMIPSAPGYVGVFHGAAVAALSVIGIAKETALAIATVSHAMQYLLVTGAGLALISHEHLSMRRVTAAATEDDEPELMELTHSSPP